MTQIKFNEMWAALTAYQPQADAAGNGESWAKMCKEKTYAAADAAAADAAYAAADAAYAAADAADAADARDAADAVYAAVYAAADAAYAAADAAGSAQKAIERINKVLVQPAQQEPVQFKCTVIDDAHPNGIPLEQWAKPQRTWVNLPDEEIKILWIQYRAALPRYLCFARTLLARAKEKNT